MNESIIRQDASKPTRLAGLAFGVPLLLVLLVCMPFIGWFVLLQAFRFVPEAKIAVYSGIKAKVTEGEVSRLYIQPPIPPELFVLIDGEAVSVQDLDPVLIQKAGFEPSRSFTNVFVRGRPSPITSMAIFDGKGKIHSLSLAHIADVSLAFSASRDGPFLTLPVPFDEFKSQFGKPDEWDYVYSNPHDPR